MSLSAYVSSHDFVFILYIYSRTDICERGVLSKHQKLRGRGSHVQGVPNIIFTLGQRKNDPPYFLK